VELPQTGPDSLNENHLRRLLVSCQYIDKLLSDIESVLNQSSSTTLFRKYRDDLSSVQRKVTQDYIARIRARLGCALDGQNLSVPRPDIAATHSIKTALEFIDIAIEELKPKYMRGYGEVPDAAVPELNGIASELQGLVQKVISSLGAGEADLAQRLANLESTTNEIELLKVLAEIICAHGLVEFRQSLAILLERLEEGNYEIAVFGRVSSGKSSLLNRIIDSEMLPVGVNPITAVPTRIAYGPTPQLKVWFADRPPQRLPASRVSEFVAEQNNPANSKHVVRIVVELPSNRLQAGVVLVDTPGLGSLATSGAAATLAYLPRCDLGVVLIDAASTLTQEDVTTVRMLYEAGTPALVLLSKADLIRVDDCKRAAEYIRKHFKTELGLDLAVHPVSAIDEHRQLLERWFEHEVLPLYERHNLLAEASLRRKIGSLRQSVQAAIETIVSRGQRHPIPESVDPRAIEGELRRGEGEFERAREACVRFARDFYLLNETILSDAADRITGAEAKPDSQQSDADLVGSILTVLVMEKTAPLLETIDASANQLSDVLASIAKHFTQNGEPDSEELISGIRETPVFNIAVTEIDMKLTAPRLLGRSAWKRRIEGKLRAQISTELSKSLSAYSGVLESWTKRVFEEIKRRFGARADEYRAQLERLAADSSGSVSDISGLRRDLARLQDWDLELNRPTDQEMLRCR